MKMYVQLYCGELSAFFAQFKKWFDNSVSENTKNDK